MTSLTQRVEQLEGKIASLFKRERTESLNSYRFFREQERKEMEWRFREQLKVFGHKAKVQQGDGRPCTCGKHVGLIIQVNGGDGWKVTTENACPIDFLLFRTRYFLRQEDHGEIQSLRNRLAPFTQPISPPHT
jgi:hypothetical protein